EALALRDVEADAADRPIDLAADEELRLQTVDGDDLSGRDLTGREWTGRRREPALDLGAGRRARQRAGLEARIEDVTDAVAEQVYRHHHREDHQPGNDRDVRCGEQQLASLAEHRAEVGARRLRAEPEKAESGG